LEGYGLNISPDTDAKRRKVYLRARALNSGRISLYYYGVVGGKTIRLTANLFLELETDDEKKKANVETLKIARTKADKLNTEVTLTGNGFDYTVKSKATLTALLQKYLKHANLSASRRNLYGGVLKHAELAGLADMQLKDINTDAVRRFVRYLSTAKNIRTSDAQPLDTNTQKAYFAALNVLFNYAVRQGAMNSNPTWKMETSEKPKNRCTERDYLTIEEVRTLHDTPCRNEEVKAAFLFACFTGLRFSDVRKLTAADIKRNDLGAYISVMMQKTSKPVKVYLSETALSFINGRLNGKSKSNIFHLTSNKVANYTLNKWAASAGIEKHVTFHTSRHTAATMMLNLGASLSTVKNLLGHSNIRTTEIYAKLLDQSQAAAMKLQDNIKL